MKEKIAKHTFYLVLILLGIISIPSESYGAPDGDVLAGDMRRISSTTMEFYMPLIKDHPILEENGEKYYATYSVSGKVVDENGEPLIGVNVQIKGTNTGTATDINGQFSLSDIDAQAILVVSYIGYQSQEVELKGQTNLTIIMQEDAQTLDEVVVVGYGSLKKVNLTGAVSTVQMDEVLRSRPLSDLSGALQGRIPGLQITSNSGKPGSKAVLNIRGMMSITGGSPLILVDNVPASIDDLNPADIESVSVLKDASASAIYGGRAAFGVVLITTKKSKMNEPIKFDYSTNLIIGQPADLFEKASLVETIRGLRDAGNNFSVLGSQDLETWEQLAIDYKVNPGKYPQGNTDVDGINYRLAETDRIKATMGPSFQQIHNFSVKQGTERTNYRISMGYADEDGILKTNKDSRNKINLNAYLNSQILPNLSYSLNTFYNNNTTYTPAHYSRLFGQAVDFGNWASTGYKVESDGSVIPYEVAENILELEVPDKLKNNNLRIFNKLDFDIIDGLKLIGEYTFENTDNDMIASESSRVYHSPMGNSPYELNNTSSYSRSFNKTVYHSINIYTSFEKEINNHFARILIGGNREQSSYSGFAAKRLDLLNPDLPSLALATGAMSNNENYSEFALLGYFVRANYSFADKYLLEVSSRYDGSSKFPEKNRFGFFPSISAGWVVSEEPFMNSFNEVVDFMKIRGSIGEIGNQNISNYLYIPSMNTIDASWVNNSTNLAALTILPPDLVSPSFTWERVRTKNIGVDLVVFKNLSTSFDYFNRETIDMLGDAAELPKVLGALAPKENVADLISKGWELSMLWRNSIGQNLSYSLGFNISDSRAFITKFDNEQGLLGQYYNGYEFGEIWGYETYGYYKVDDFVEGTLDANYLNGTLKEGIPIYYTAIRQNPGDIRYVDQNGDGVIDIGNNTLSNPGDKKIIGNNTRRYQFGINGGLNFKNIDFSFFMQGIGKRDTWINTPAFFPYYNQYKFFNKNQLDYWTPENTDAYFFRNYPEASGNTEINRNTPQTKYLLNGAYLRIKNIELGYTLPNNSFMNKVSLSNARMFFSAENILTFKHIPSGIDPELEDINQGIGYPFIRRISFGLNISF